MHVLFFIFFTSCGFFLYISSDLEKMKNPLNWLNYKVQITVQNELINNDFAVRHSYNFPPGNIAPFLMSVRDEALQQLFLSPKIFAV